MNGIRTHEIVKNISHISRNILLSKLMKRIITILNRNHKLKITLLFDSIHRLKCVFYVWNLVKFSCDNQYYLKWKHYLLYTVIYSGSQINVTIESCSKLDSKTFEHCSFVFFSQYFLRSLL